MIASSYSHLLDQRLHAIAVGHRKPPRVSTGMRYKPTLLDDVEFKNKAKAPEPNNPETNDYWDPLFQDLKAEIAGTVPTETIHARALQLQVAEESDEDMPQAPPPPAPPGPRAQPQPPRAPPPPRENVAPATEPTVSDPVTSYAPVQRTTRARGGRSQPRLRSQSSRELRQRSQRSQRSQQHSQ
jgi:hypothetical protein